MLVDKINRNSGIFRILFLMPGGTVNYFYLMLSSLFINIAALALPIMLIQIYDRIIANSAIGSLSWLASGCFIALIFECLLRTLRGFISGWLAANFESEISCNLIEKIIFSKKDDFEKNEIGEYFEKLNSASVLKSIYGGQVFQYMMDMPFAFLYLVMIYYLAGAAVWVPIACIVFYYFLLIIMQLPVNSLREEKSLNEKEKNSKLMNLLKNIFSIKALADEEIMVRNYSQSVKKLSKSSYKLSIWQNIISSFSSVVPQISLFGVVLIGGYLVISGSFTMGVVTACIILAGRAIGPFLEVGNFWFRKAEIKIALQNLSEIKDLQKERKISNPIMGNYIYGLVELENISYSPSGMDNDFIIDDFSLKINRREFCCIECADRNVSNILPEIIMGRVQTAKGKAYIDGFKASEWELSAVNHSVKVFSDKCHIFNGNIIDNITVFDNSHTKAAYETAMMLGIDSYAANLPKGYETVLKQNSIQTIPSGLLHRITLGRAFVTRPRIIILNHFDEILDKGTFDLLIWLLNKLKGSLTIIAITSNKELLGLAERKVKIVSGKIVSGS